ncbi:ATP-grasp domain-containing protein [Kitasatospora viridis]|uniref:Biotin carboxylase n=1 Tax=Kitasatospora viridis TaxID=281105 RepID=A0A561TST7_9ACTN|nr:ATP-grasp domain-containing protein [Kitasatospora viridis]TWF90176.1 biotin carboxylase [Kitasatospora viridis]
MNAPVVLVDPYSSGVALGRALRRAGFDTHAVLSSPAPAPEYTKTFQPADHAGVVSAGVTSAGPGFDRVLQLVRAIGPVAVIPGAESGVELADALAAELTPELANDPARSHARRDKAAMMATLRAAGIPTVRTLAVTEAEGCAARAAEQGLSAAGDLVVKPARSSLSDGLTLVPAGGDLEAAVRSVLGARNLLGSVNETVLVQERIHGTEYVVDTFTEHGRHIVTNICRYTKVAVGDSFAVYESTDFLPEDAPETPVLVAYVRQVLDALGVRFGPCHSEVMLTEDGPRLMETGARLAGAGLPGACELATGSSAISRYLDRLHGQPQDTRDYVLQRRVRGVYLVFRTPGTVTNTAVLDRIRVLPSCRHLHLGLSEGDPVAPTTGLMSTMTRGWALLAHRDPARVERDHAEFRRIEAELKVVEHGALQ